MVMIRKNRYKVNSINNLLILHIKMISFKDQLKNVTNIQNIEDIINTYNKEKIYFLERDRIRDIIDEYIKKWIYANKTSTKIFSRKARIRISNQKFHLHLKDLKTHLFFYVTFTKKGFSTKWLSLFYVSTSKGLIYFHCFPSIKNAFDCHQRICIYD